jgi:serpin B
VWLSDAVAVTGGAGAVPNDPVRGLPAARYALLGLRVRPRLGPRRPAGAGGASGTAAPAAVGPDAVVLEVDGSAPAADGGAGGAPAPGENPPGESPPGEAAPAPGGLRRVSVRPAAGARRVRLRAAATGWHAVDLARGADGAWWAALALPAGPHRVQVRVDDGPWRAPGTCPRSTTSSAARSGCWWCPDRGAARDGARRPRVVRVSRVARPARVSRPCHPAARPAMRLPNVLRPARAAAASALLLLAACHERAAGPGAEAPRRALTPAEAGAVRASNAFAFDLLREVGAERAHQGRNLVLSPYSGAAALGMALNGAAGETQAGMRRALGLADRPVGEANATFRGLTAHLLGADPKVTVRSANSLWAAEGFPVRAAFADTVRRYFDAEARAVAFGTAEATRAINAWASQHTDGRIPKVFEDGQPGGDYVLVLMNALYFKGAWAARFDAARTAARPFRLAGGATVGVPTMSRDGTAMRVGGDGGARVGELAYGNGAYAMTVVLPPAGVDAEAFAASLTPARWDALVGSLVDATLPVQLPKFALAGESVWNAPLQRLGMDAAFDPRRADFSPVSARCLPQGPPGRDCHVGFVKQNVDVRVDEEGTVAAAVTSVGVGVTSAPAAFAVDRPFVFAIRERASGAILFLGRVLDPRAP